MVVGGGGGGVEGLAGCFTQAGELPGPGSSGRKWENHVARIGHGILRIKGTQAVVAQPGCSSPSSSARLLLPYSTARQHLP